MNALHFWETLSDILLCSFLSLPELKMVFRLFDKDQNGYISKEEVMIAMGSMKLSADPEKIDQLFKQVDLDGVFIDQKY